MDEQKIYELLQAASMAFHRLEEEGMELNNEEEKAWEEINDWLLTK